MDDCIKVNVPCFSTSALEFFTVICILYVTTHNNSTVLKIDIPP